LRFWILDFRIGGMGGRLSFWKMMMGINIGRRG
jgi:hypothetical protein